MDFSVKHEIYPIMELLEMDERFYCNACKSGTRHEIVAEYSQSRYDYFWDSNQFQRGQILMCLGCDELSFRLFVHPYEFQEETDEVDEYIYPKRLSKKRETDYFFYIPAKINKIYKQTNIAFDSGLYLFTAIGLRTLIEAIVVDKFQPKEYSYSIKSKIDALKKHFDQKVIQTLHEFRFFGNKAIHEVDEPSRGDLHRALNVVEGIMTFYYKVEEYTRIYKDLKDGEL